MRRTVLLHVLLPAASALLLSCAWPASSGPVSFTVDLRRGHEGVIAVRMEIPGDAGEPFELSSFIQPRALRLDSLKASQGGESLGVERRRDERGFERWDIGPAQASGSVRIDYLVRPGTLEEAKMAGPTGYRFGYLDGTFGVFGGRQVFLLRTDPLPPTSIRVRFLPPEGQQVVKPWPAGGDPSGFTIEGGDAAARLVQAVIGVGRFATAASREGSFRVWASERLPDSLRESSLSRALALEDYLGSRLGRPGRTYDLLLVPRTEEGMSISVTPGPQGMVMSMGDGLPARWLSIGRGIGQAYVADRLRDRREPAEEEWVFEALPTYLTVIFSGQDGWRSRQAWNELFYYNTAGLSLDLRRPGDLGDSPDALKREWRGALVLDRLSHERQREGRESVEDFCMQSLRSDGRLDVDRLTRDDLSKEVRARLSAWLSPEPHPFPFPGDPAGAGPVRLAAPRPAPRVTGRTRRVDLYLGGRNFGLLEQCGCRSHQIGGMARRSAALRERLKSGGPALALELGDAVPYDQSSLVLNPQKVAESDLVLSLLAHSRTAASVVGYAELSYGPRFLAERIAKLTPGFRLLSANVRGPGLDLPAVLEAKPGGIPLRIAAVVDPDGYHLGRALEFEDATAPLVIEEPAKAIKRVLGKAPSPDLTVAAGPLGPSAVLRIHEALPDLRMIVTDDYFRFLRDPRFVFERPLDGYATLGMLDGTLLILLQSDSYAIVRLGLSLDESGRILGAELEDLELGDDLPEDPFVRARLDAHYARLAAVSGLAEVPPIGSRLAARLDSGYVGAEACGSCHESETSQWRTTAHAAAFATMLERRRQGVPGCYACHVTGYGQRTGYLSMADRKFRHVQCESCHGPGGRHVERPARENIIHVPTASICLECHNEKHSDMNEGNFRNYWSKIVHATAAAASR